MQDSMQTNKDSNRPESKLGKTEEDVAVDREIYQLLVGRLIYLSHTLPVIAYVVSVISQFTHSPKVIHLQAATVSQRYTRRRYLVQKDQRSSS